MPRLGVNAKGRSKRTNYEIDCPYCAEVLPVFQDKNGNYYLVCSKCLVDRSRREFWHADFLLLLLKKGRLSEKK